MSNNSHLQRFLNSHNEYLIEDLLNDKFILDVICILYLCNKCTTIECLIEYFTSDNYEIKRSITHLKDILKTLEYFRLIENSGKVVRLDRGGIQIIEQKQNITRATTTQDYSYINEKGKFTINAINKLKDAYIRKGIDFDLLELCREEEQAKALKYDVIITKFNVAIIFSTINANQYLLLRKGDALLKRKLIDTDRCISILYPNEAYVVNKELLDIVFNQYSVKFINIDVK